MTKSSGDNMMRMQISLHGRDYALAKEQAARLRISLAEFVRHAIRDTLAREGNKPWIRYAGFIESGNARSSGSIDQIVYGKKD